MAQPEALERHKALVDALSHAVFEGQGVSSAAARAAAQNGDAAGEPLASYLATVRDASYRITDARIEALRAAGHDEEEIFELTVAAALGTALRGLESAIDAVRGAR